MYKQTNNNFFMVMLRSNKVLSHIRKKVAFEYHSDMETSITLYVECVSRLCKIKRSVSIDIMKYIFIV